MRRTLVTLGLLLMFVSNVLAQGTPEEKDFIARFKAFQKAGNMAHVGTVYDVGDLPKQELFDMLEATIVRGIKEVKFEEMFPAIRDEIEHPTEINGVKYVPILKSYKMFTVEYQTPIKNGSSGRSVLIGMKDGKLFICGWKKSEKQK